MTDEDRHVDNTRADDAELQRRAAFAQIDSAIFDPSFEIYRTVIELPEAVAEGVTLGVAILSHGVIVTGDLISEDAYYKIVSERFRALGSDSDEPMPPEFNELADTIARHGELSPEERAARDARHAETGVPPLVGWIALKNARLMMGAQVLPAGGALPVFRLRASAVDGFWVGHPVAGA